MNFLYQKTNNWNILISITFIFKTYLLFAYTHAMDFQVNFSVVVMQFCESLYLTNRHSTHDLTLVTFKLQTILKF